MVSCFLFRYITKNMKIKRHIVNLLITLSGFNIVLLYLFPYSSLIFGFGLILITLMAILIFHIYSALLFDSFSHLVSYIFLYITTLFPYFPLLLSLAEISPTLSLITLKFQWLSIKHTTSFRRPYNVHNVKTTSYGCQNNVVCVLG